MMFIHTIHITKYYNTYNNFGHNSGIRSSIFFSYNFIAIFTTISSPCI